MSPKKKEAKHLDDMADSKPLNVLEKARGLHRSHQHEAALAAYRRDPGASTGPYRSMGRPWRSVAEHGQT